MKCRFRIYHVMLLFISLFIFGCVGQSTEELNAASGYLDVTHMFALKDLKGETVRLDEVLKDNKAVLLNFWATWCPPCREEIPDLIKMQEKYGASGFTVLGIDVGESQKKVEKFVNAEGVNYPIVLDPDQRVTEIYRVVGIPTSILINRDGRVLGQYHAFTKKLESDVEKAIA